MIYGYARVSTKQQNIDRQVRNILDQDAAAKVYKEAYTGTTQARPEWKKLLKAVKPGDTIIFDQVSRMSRNAAEGFEEYKNLFNSGVNLVFIKEPHINTATYKAAQDTTLEATGNEIADLYIEATNKVLLLLAERQIKLAFDQAEKEVLDLHKRTSEGMKTAKLNGKQIGRAEGKEITTKKSVAAKEIIRKHSKDFGGTLNDLEVIALAGISRNSYYKYKRELSQE